MRTLTLLSFLIVIASPSAHAATIEADSAITAATVFADRATLTRKTTIDIPAGAHEVTFENLPIRLYPDSLRVEGKGGASVILGALSHKVINQADLIVPREKEISDQIRILDDRKLIINAEIEALSQKKAFFTNLMGKASERSREEIADFNLKPDQWTGAAAAVADGIEEAQKNTVLKQLEMRKIDEELAKLRQDLNQLRTGSKQSYTVALPVEAKSATRLSLELIYQMPNATWRPVYDARLDTKTGKLEIVQYGAVTQRTGEDWTDINLTLSTARPHRGASLPPLQPMWVDLGQAYAKRSRGMAESSMMAQNLAAPMAADMAMEAEIMEERDAVMRTATIDTGGFTAEYHIPGPSDVLADGTESKLLIGPFATKTDMQIHVKPQLSSDAFLVAHTILEGEAPILPGSVSLFRDGAYVGQNSLPLLRPGKDYNLFFGIDDQIEVKRETLEDKAGEAGLLGRDNVKEQRTITSINNLRNKAIALVVTESVPVSKNKDIETEILKDHTTPGYREDLENKKGVLQWTKDLAAGQKTDIKLGWKVTWPKDESIIGLP